MPCQTIGLKIGFIDHTGRFIITPRFTEAHDFSDGLATVRIAPDGQYGFVDRKGAPITEFRFDEAGDFSEGLAWVRVERRTVSGIRDPGRCGYVDHSGRFVIKAQFAKAGPFSEGLAPVSFWDHAGMGYIDKSGKLAIPARFLTVEPFSEGLAMVCHEALSTFWRCEYIDKTNRVVIDSVQGSGPFSAGVAIATELNEAHEPSGWPVYIDKTGHVIAPTVVETRPAGKSPSKRK